MGHARLLFASPRDQTKPLPPQTDFVFTHNGTPSPIVIVGWASTSEIFLTIGTGKTGVRRLSYVRGSNLIYKLSNQRTQESFDSVIF